MKQITRKTPLREVFKLGRQCRKCGHCCTDGTGFLAEHDIKNIAEYLGMSERELIDECLEAVTLFNTIHYRPVLVQNNGANRCIFFNDEIGCTIHDVKPVQCRVGNCSEHGEELSVWFKLNFFVNPNNAESVRQWAVYLESGGSNIPGGELHELVHDPVKLIRILNYKILR